jgi:hypothetical protein
MAALGANLRSEELRDELVHELLVHVKAKATAANRQDGVGDTRVHMEATRKTLGTQIDNMVAAIRERGHSRALLNELDELEAKAARIDETLAAPAAPPPKEITENDVRAFLNSAMHRFGDISGYSGNPTISALSRQRHSITSSLRARSEGSGHVSLPFTSEA